MAAMRSQLIGAGTRAGRWLTPRRFFRRARWW